MLVARSYWQPVRTAGRAFIPLLRLPRPQRPAQPAHHLSRAGGRDAAGPGRLQAVHQLGHLGQLLGRVGRPGQQHQLRVGDQPGGRAEQDGHALLPGDAADEYDVRTRLVDAVTLEHIGVRVGMVLGGVYAVTYHPDPFGER